MKREALINQLRDARNTKITFDKGVALLLEGYEALMEDQKELLDTLRGKNETQIP